MPKIGWTYMDGEMEPTINGFLDPGSYEYDDLDPWRLKRGP